MKDELIELLETFEYPVREQGSLTEDEQYPDSFFTFWNNDTYDGNHYDNDAIAFVWAFDINFYSIDPDLVNSILADVRTLLKKNGWIISGKGHDVSSDEVTHTGRGLTALYVERQGEE